MSDLGDKGIARGVDTITHQASNIVRTILKQCQNYRYHHKLSSKFMLQVILNRLNTTAEKLLAEEQAG